MTASRQRSAPWGLIAGILIVLPACTQQFKYEPKPLPILNSYNAAFEDIQQGVLLRARVIDYQDGKSLLNGNGKYLYANAPLVPIQFSIENNSGNAWTINPATIAIEPASFQKIKKQVMNNTAGRVAMITLVGALLSAPAIIAGIIALPSAALLGPSLLILSSAAIGGGVVATTASTSVAVYEGYRSHTQNISIEEDIHRISLLDDVTIQPGKKASKIIFIPEEQFKSSFELVCINPANELDQLHFGVNLKHLNSPEH